MLPIKDWWIAVVAVIVAALLALLAQILFADKAQPSEAQCMDAETREVVRNLALDGLAAGFKQNVTHLYDIWVKNPDDQPKRAIVGLHNAIDAYVRARRDAQKYNPPVCKEDRL
jgi:hypothetical protein